MLKAKGEREDGQKTEAVIVLTTIMMSLLPPVHSFDVYTGPIVFSLLPTL